LKAAEKYSFGYHFDFAESGLFTIVDSNGACFYEQVFPFFEKTVSHLIWIFFWMSLILASTCFCPQTWLRLSNPLFMIFIFIHLFLFGCRLTTLLLKKGLKPILFPPLWIRVTRKLQKGSGLELLKKYSLETHPGLLSNLARVYYNKGEIDQAAKVLRLALVYAPDNQFLRAFLMHALQLLNK
jgi:hypothetical protein